MATIHMNDRTLAHIIAGLRLLQRAIEHGTLDNTISDIATDGDTHKLYTLPEIDALCEGMNMGDA